jgi:hypothetical protein
MKPEILSELQRARDFPALTEVILTICGPFGQVHALSLVHNKAAGRVACLIELDSVRQHPAMVRELGATLVSGAVCIEIPVSPGFVAYRPMRLMISMQDVESIMARHHQKFAPPEVPASLGRPQVVR